MWFFDFNAHVLTDLSHVLRITFWVSIITCVITGGAEYWLDRKRQIVPRGVITAVLCISVIALVGAVAGFLAGLSRVGVVGQIVPAAMSIVGGFGIYIFGVKKIDNLLLPGTIAAFTLALMLGLSDGANKRTRSAAFTLMQDRCFGFFMNPQTLSPDVLPTAQTMFGDACKIIISATRKNAYTLKSE